MITTVCAKCKVEKGFDEFPIYKHVDGRAYYRRSCTECFNAQVVAWQEKNPDAKRRSHARRKWNLSLEEYDELLSRGCEVCGTREQLTIDHDHSCCPIKSQSCGKCIRGVLCNRHNLAEGCLRGNPEEAIALAEYMRRTAK